MYDSRPSVTLVPSDFEVYNVFSIVFVLWGSSGGSNKEGFSREIHIRTYEVIFL